VSTLCQTPGIRSRQYLSGPTWYWLVVDKVGVIGGNFWDILFNLPAPCNVFTIGSIRSGDEANSLWMSLVPTNKPRGALFTAMSGQEQIFPLNGSQLILAAPHTYTVLKFKETVNQVYFHMGSENGALSRYSVMCANDDRFKLTGGLYF